MHNVVTDGRPCQPEVVHLVLLVIHLLAFGWVAAEECQLCALREVPEQALWCKFYIDVKGIGEASVSW